MTKKIILFITVAMIIATMGIALVGAAQPGIQAPPPVTVSATGTLTHIIDAVLGNAKPTGNYPTDYNITREPAGNDFPLGITNIVWTLSNTVVVGEINIIATDIQVVTVTDPVVDNTPPTITAPTDITVQATVIPMHVTLVKPIVVDDIDPNPTVTNDAPAGSNFPLGTTTVTWTACDHASPTPNCNTATQLVTITPAAIKLTIVSYSPPSLTVEDTAPSNIKFNITMNQAANVVWSIDGVSIQSKQLVTEDSYRANFSTIGTHVLTVNVQNGTDSDTKTWNWNIKGTLEVSAHPAFVNVGQSTNVTLKVSRRCGIESADTCTGRTPASGVSISLTGIVDGSGSVNDTTGEFVTTINTTANGTINVTASKSGYVNAYTNITVGTAPVVVPVPPSSGGGGGGSSGGSSSGGGGGGGSAEPYENIYKYEIQEHNVFTTPVSFKYVTPDLVIYEVLVTSTQSDIAALRIEVLKDTSKLVSMPAPGIVYKNLNAWIDYKRIKNATIRFKVENSWIDGNKLSDSNIKMNKWDNTNKRWIELLTNVKNKDGQYTYLEAQTDTFSSFAISVARPLPTTVVDSSTPASTSAANISPVPIDASMTKRNDYTKLEIGIVAIVVVLIFYMLRIKKT